MANIEDKTENKINNKIEIETQNEYIENQYIQNENKINNEIETENGYIENENEYNPFEIRIDSKHVVCVMISSQMETFVGDILYVSYFYKL